MEVLKQLNGRDFAGRCTRCIAADEDERILAPFPQCRRLPGVGSGACGCCLLRHRGQDCSASEQSVVMPAIQAPTRPSRSAAVPTGAREGTRSTTRTSGLQVDTTVYLPVRSPNKSRPAAARSPAAEDSSPTSDHADEPLFFSSGEDNSPARAQSPTADLSVGEGAAMELDWSVRSDIPDEQRSRSDSASARVVRNSGRRQVRYAGPPLHRGESRHYQAEQAGLLDGNFFP